MAPGPGLGVASRIRTQLSCPVQYNFHYALYTLTSQFSERELHHETSEAFSEHCRQQLISEGLGLTTIKVHRSSLPSRSFQKHTGQYEQEAKCMQTVRKYPENIQKVEMT